VIISAGQILRWMEVLEELRAEIKQEDADVSIGDLVRVLDEIRTAYLGRLESERR
jgi:hypothetical protein